MIMSRLFEQTLHHFLSISLDDSWSITGHIFKHCKIAQNMHDSYSLLSQCGINLVYYLICIHNGLSHLMDDRAICLPWDK